MAHAFCNPINVDYRFQTEREAARNDGVCYRESGDPSIAWHQGRFWLFPSKSGGYWHSKDMVDWSFVPSSLEKLEQYAPDVRVMEGRLHISASGDCPVYREIDALNDEWDKVGEHSLLMDPSYFQDDDGRVYLYYGASNENPIYGVEVDPATFAYVGEPLGLIHANTAEHGWEIRGEDNIGDEPPWIEGPWMTKHDGRYYLQYASPGTELNSYCDAVYVSDKPLGPFQPAEHNPFSAKAGGFITGAGHGSTFQDRYGNWWHTATMRVSRHFKNERRIGIFPAGFDKDGMLFCNTRFGDYPMRMPSGKWDPWQDAFAGWMLLSYDKAVTASSAQADFPAANVVDENVQTFWSAATGNEGECLQIDLGGVSDVHAIQVNHSDYGCRQFAREGEPLCHQFVIEGSMDGNDWAVLIDKSRSTEDRPHDLQVLDRPAPARYIRITNIHTPAGGPFSLSGLRVFGLQDRPKPNAVDAVQVQRSAADPRIVDLSWEADPDATGYNVCWGIAPDKLYLSQIVYGASELTIRSLHRNKDYVYRVDAFNEAGIVPGTKQP